MSLTRQRVSERFLRGQGIEIGALHAPLWTSAGTRVRYVDRMNVAGLRDHYPELGHLPLVEVDVIDDGETLSTFGDGSLDFIIANHMLEHCENPLGTIRNHLAKLVHGGRTYYAVPDRRHCFDRDRPLTSFEHLVRDDRDGPAVSRSEHFREWARLVCQKHDPQEMESEARGLEARGYSIHFHVWDAPSFRAFLRSAGQYLGPVFHVEYFRRNGGEVIAVLRKGARSPGWWQRWLRRQPEDQKAA